MPPNDSHEPETYASVRREVEFLFLELPDIDELELRLEQNGYSQPALDEAATGLADEPRWRDDTHDIYPAEPYDHAEMIKDTAEINTGMSVALGAMSLFWLSVEYVTDKLPAVEIVSQGAGLVGRVSLFGAFGFAALAAVHTLRHKIYLRKTA
jgi:hypothetical protein